MGEIIDDGESDHEGDDQRTKKKEREKKADEISFSLSHPWAQSVDVNETVVASTSSTKEERAGAVERLYKILQGEKSPEASDMASIQSALLARVYDTHAGVLHALYSSPEVFFLHSDFKHHPSKAPGYHRLANCSGPTSSRCSYCTCCFPRRSFQHDIPGVIASRTRTRAISVDHYNRS